MFEQFKEAIDDNDNPAIIECLEVFKEKAFKYKYPMLMPLIEDWKTMIMNDDDDNSLNIQYEDIENILNYMLTSMKEKQEANQMQAPEYQSTQISRSNSPKSVTTAPQVEECLLKELKPLRMSCYFKSHLLVEEFEEQIKLFNNEEKREKTDFLKNLPKPLKNMNPFIDCNYPFKEERFSCILF